MKKIPIAYIAGPYRNSKEDAMARFGKVRKALWRIGYFVIDPIALTHDMDKEFSDDEFISRDLAAVGVVDLLVLLDGWESSAGATRERNTAVANGIPVYEWETDSVPSIELFRARLARQEAEEEEDDGDDSLVICDRAGESEHCVDCDHAKPHTRYGMCVIECPYCNGAYCVYHGHHADRH